MQQVVYAGGKLYGSLGTLVLKPSGGFRDGVAWFVVKPGSVVFPLTATVSAQGYVAVPREYLIDPSIAVNSNGEGVIAFSLTGPDFFPSLAYTRFNGTGTEKVVHLAFPGAAPEDGFTGYAEFGGVGAARWGDYSAATIAPDGSFWFAGEYIPNRPRTFFTNWGTAIGALAP